MANESELRSKWALIQRSLGLVQDGIPGIGTADAVMRRMGIGGDEPSVAPTRWPTQADVRSGESIFGRPGDESNLVTIDLPYLMTFEGAGVVRTRCHKLVAEPLVRIFERTLDHYGLEEIRRLRLDVYGGCCQFRKTVSGRVDSLHSWGIAVDMDPERNAYPCKAPHAGLSRPECDAFWRFVEDEGAVGLGRTLDVDWMHFQFARLA